MTIILLIVFILLATSVNFCWRHDKRKIRKSFVLLYWGKFVFFMLQHRLLNLTPNMLEVGHPKRSSMYLGIIVLTSSWFCGFRLEMHGFPRTLMCSACLRSISARPSVGTDGRGTNFTVFSPISKPQTSATEPIFTAAIIAVKPPKINTLSWKKTGGKVVLGALIYLRVIAILWRFDSLPLNFGSFCDSWFHKQCQ